MKKKTFYALTVVLFTTIGFTSCEKTDLPLDEANMITRLENFHGENIELVTRQLTGEGYQDIDFDGAVAFAKGNEQYTLYHNTGDGKTINSAAYMQSMTTSITDLYTKYDAWKKLISDNGVSGLNFKGVIAADNFSDFGHNYTDSVKHNDEWAYIYTNEMDFQTVFITNRANLEYCSEKWYEGKGKSSKEYSVQYTKNLSNTEPSARIKGNVGLMVSDFTIK